jgi:hypothetical protein
MVESMMRGSVDDVLQPMAGDHVRIVNEHRPDVDPNEEDKMEVFLNGEEVGKYVVGKRLEIAVDWVECVGGERGGYNPFVVWLVNVLVDEGVVFPSVNPVDAVIGEQEETTNRIHKRNHKNTNRYTYVGIERKNQVQPYSSMLSYAFEYPKTSPSNHGRVNNIITGKLCKLITISCLTWFFKNLGCFIIA